MKRTQIQIPDPLYEQVRRVAELRDWSISEVIRRAVEGMLAELPEAAGPGGWQPPEPRRLGKPRVPPERWRDLLADDET